MISENAKVTINLGLLVLVIITIIGSAFKIGTVLEKYDGRIGIVEESAVEHRHLEDKVDINSDRLHSQDIKLVEIQTDLKWIRAKMEDEE